MANSTTNIDTISVSQASKEVTANAFFDASSQAATYGRRASTSSGLTWGYYGGNVIKTDGTLASIANGTLTLTASATNYIVADRSTGIVSASTTTTNWNNTSAYWRLYSVVVGSGTVTSWTDFRLSFAVALNKSDVGLSNVDNTSDATKNSATATLTNKTISLADNTITGTIAQFNTALSDADFATLAGTETLTNKTISGGTVNATDLTSTNDIVVNGATVGLGGGGSSTNLAFGTGALYINTTGFGLCAVGAYALSGNETGNYNCAVGYSALASSTSSDNTAIGTLAGQNLSTGGSNTFIGRGAGSAVTTGGSNTIIGRIAGTSSLASTIILGAGTTERARCDSSGNWGLGTTTPATRLDVNGTITATGWSGGGIVTESATQTLTNKTITGGTVNPTTLQEGSVPAVVQTDIGTSPNELPLNQYLGNLAYMNGNNVVLNPVASVTPNGIGDMVFQLTNDTTLVVKVKGSDGTVRSVTLTLA